jgi:hypothetical protein
MNTRALGRKEQDRGNRRLFMALLFSHPARGLKTQMQSTTTQKLQQDPSIELIANPMTRVPANFPDQYGHNNSYMVFNFVENVSSLPCGVLQASRNNCAHGRPGARRAASRTCSLVFATTTKVTTLIAIPTVASDDSLRASSLLPAN